MSRVIPRTIKWVIGNNGAGKRSWFIYRDRSPDDPGYMSRGPLEYHTNENGRLIRYTYAGALDRARQMNEALDSANGRRTRNPHTVEKLNKAHANIHDAVKVELTKTETEDL